MSAAGPSSRPLYVSASSSRLLPGAAAGRPTLATRAVSSADIRPSPSPSPLSAPPQSAQATPSPDGAQLAQPTIYDNLAAAAPVVPPVPTVQAACVCCSTVLAVPVDRRAFRCAICATTNDRTPTPEPDRVYHIGESALDALNADALAERIPLIFDRQSHTLATKAFHAVHARLYERAISEPTLAEALLKAVKALILRPPNPLTAPAAAILLACPLLLRHCDAVTLSFSDRVDMLGRLYAIVANLDNEAHHQLASIWRRSLDIDDFSELIRAGAVVLSSYVTSAHLPWRWKGAARMMALYRAVSPAIPPDRFYVLALEAGGAAPMCSDFEIWQGRASTPDTFTWCSYPFLLPLSQKLAILRYEARRDAQALARRAVYARTVCGADECPQLILRIRREHLLRDSLLGVSRNLDNLRKELRIVFVGEEGIDAGGVRREWFSLVIEALFSPQYDMWQVDDDSGVAWPNALSHAGESEFHLTGVLCALAAKHGTPIDVPLAPAMYRKLLGKDLGLDDLRGWRPELARGLQQLLDYEGDVEETFCRSFVYEAENCGQLYRAELVPDGADVPVTNSNRKDFVRLYVEYAFAAARKQFNAFRSGFMHVLRGNALTLFAAEELELLVRGSDTPVDLHQLKLNTKYRGFDTPSASDPTLRLFWRWMQAASDERRRQLIRFVAGTGRLPATGHMNLTIHALGTDQKRLPVSHTCFNALMLPRYTSIQTLHRRLVFALENSQGFELK